jgi:hypothetical protein
LKVACDLIGRGYKIALPYGEDWDFDLIVCRSGVLERVQVKHCVAKAGVITVRCTSHSLTNGKVRATKRYTPKTIDWLAAYDPSSDGCYYIPAVELADGRSTISLRLTAALNNQKHGIRMAVAYTEI